MFFKIKSYIQFLLKSTNQHAVHSPFVYDLVTKCFYQNVNSKNNKKINGVSKKESELLNKIIDYFKPTTILEIGTNLGIGTVRLKIKNLISIKKCDVILKNDTFNLIYFGRNNQTQILINCFEKCLNTINNDTVLIIDAIHSSKEMDQVWQTIKNHKKVTVTVDVYKMGIVFFRKEQEKEHFVIRV